MGKSQKGGEFEREFCKDLSRWWTNGARDDIFWRTAGSGGRATARRKQGRTTANSNGDIMATDVLGIPLLNVFAFELKRGYSKHTIVDVFDKAPNSALQEYENWIVQAEESQRNSDAESWAIVTRRDRRVAMLYMPTWALNTLTELQLLHEVPHPHMEMTLSVRRQYGGQVQKCRKRISCILVSSFFASFTPEVIKRWIGKDKHAVERRDTSFSSGVERLA